MDDIKKVIAWLADTELYYQQEGSEPHDSDHQCRMAHAAISVIEAQQAEIERLKTRLNVYEWENGDRKNGRTVTGMDDIRDIDGLWCDDITFCPERCGWKSCPRNRENIRDKTVPHSYSVEVPKDCPKLVR